jgi:hypothetical protein
MLVYVNEGMKWEDSFRLHALTFNYLDLIFSQPVKLVDQGVYLPVGGIDLAQEGGLLVGRAGLLKLFVEIEHLIHQGDHAIVAGPVLRIGDFARLLDSSPGNVSSHTRPETSPNPSLPGADPGDYQ